MSRFTATYPIPFNASQPSTIPSPPSEEAVSKRSNVVSTKSNKKNVRDFMALPPTPPDEPIVVSHKKRSVSFRLPPEILGTSDTYDDGYIPEELYPPLSSSPPELECVQLSKDILVALVEREKDMQELVAKNKPFFETLKAILGPHEKWQAFNKLLYTPRAEMCDEVWMSSLADYLRPNPALLQKLKDIVGYLENGYNDDDTDSDTSWQNEYTDITRIRDYADKLRQFESTYPQFFIKARECLSQEDRSVLNRKKERTAKYDLFREFKEIFFADRNTLDDADWQMLVYDCLDNWPDLAAELEHIVAYEAQDSDDEIDDNESSGDDEDYIYTS